nr:MAG TPA: hypothetical protein [Caudoviricetes sp.]
MSLVTDILKRAASLPVKQKRTAKEKQIAPRLDIPPSGVKGVSKLNRNGYCEWRAIVWCGNRNVNLGSFRSVARASLAYRLWQHWAKSYPESVIPNKPQLRQGEIRRYNCERV